MRVLFIALKFGRLGGLEIYNLNLVQALAKAGHTVDVWGVFDNETDTQTSRAERIYIHTLMPKSRLAMSLYFRYSWQRLLLRRLRTLGSQYDLIIAGHVKVLPILSRASLPARLPYWVCTYGIEVWNQWSRNLYQAFKNSANVISISQYTGNIIKQRVSSAKISVLYPGVDIEWFRPSNYGHDEVKKTLLTVGRLDPAERYKGHDMVIHALPQIQSRVPYPVEYWIVGDGGDRQRLEQVVTKLGVGNAVKFWGSIGDNKLLGNYHRSDLFIMPSQVIERPDGSWTGEGFGIVYIEAAACGKPVIASNQGGAPETILDGVTGFAVDPMSPEAIADAASRLLSDPVLAQRMGEAGRQFVVENFSLSVFQQRVAKLLQENGF